MCRSRGVVRHPNTLANGRHIAGRVLTYREIQHFSCSHAVCHCISAAFTIYCDVFANSCFSPQQAGRQGNQFSSALSLLTDFVWILPVFPLMSCFLSQRPAQGPASHLAVMSSQPPEGNDAFLDCLHLSSAAHFPRGLRQPVWGLRLSFGCSGPFPCLGSCSGPFYQHGSQMMHCASVVPMYLLATQLIWVLLQ